MCLLPLLVENIRVEEICNIHFINPDGTKVPNEGDGLICDITYGLLGLEVKYSETGSLTYTSKQLNSFFLNDKTLQYESDPNFKGFIAIVNVKKGELKVAGCQIIHISAEKFIEYYAENSVLQEAKNNFGSKSKNIQKTCFEKGNLLPGWVHIENETDYLALFGLGLK